MKKSDTTIRTRDFYSGVLVVEDNEFSLEAKNIVILKSKIRFKLKGKDEDGKIFETSGIAKKIDSLYYCPSGVIEML